MKLVDDWKKAWTWLTTWFASMGILALEAYQQMDVFLPAIKANFPDAWVHRATQVLLVFIIIGRLIKQGKSNVQPASQ